MMTKFAVYNLDRNNRFDYSKAERELGYHTRPYAETLRDEARWLVAEGKIKGNVHVAKVHEEEKTVEEKLLSTMESRALIRSVAEAPDAGTLDALLRRAGIEGYSGDDLLFSMEALKLTRSSGELMDMFSGNDYAACCSLLQAHGLETDPEEYDLIVDVLRCAENTDMGREIDHTDNTHDAAEVLKRFGYYHITAEFLDVLVQYAHLLDQAGLLDEEDAEKSFRQRCADNITTLCAVGVIASLRYGVQTPFSPSWLIAISGGAALVQKRFVP